MVKRGDKIWMSFALILVLILSLVLVSANIFQDKTQGDFSGVYNWTFYNSSGFIQLNNSHLNGTYTSRIFDATSVARWNNVSWQGNLPSSEYYYIIDISADFWKSNNTGYNWSSVKIDYNGADGNSADSLSKNSSKSLFIANGQDIWVSEDHGISWNKINDDFNGAETYNNAVFTLDKNDNLIIIDTNEQVWKSTNSGSSFTKINSSFSGVAPNVFGIAINNSNAYFVVDLLSDVWVSNNAGVSWTNVNDKYNVGSTNGGNGMDINSTGSLFIVDAQDIWVSNNNAVSWTKVNDDFNGADVNNAKLMYFDSNNNLYVLDTSEDIYFSNDSGLSFVRIAEDMNGANGDVVGMTSLIVSSNITLQVRNCSLSNCSDGIFVDANSNNINLTSKYFQYRAYFSSQDSSITPKLYNVSLDYTILDNTPPSFSDYYENPINNSDYISGNRYRFNVTINETNPGSVWIEWQGVNYTNGNIINNSNVYTFNISNLATGTYSYRWWANDTLGNTNSSSFRYYTLDKAYNDLFLFSSVGWSPINYGTSSTFSCSATYGIPNLYLDGLNVSNPITLSLGVGAHNIKCNITESQNYSGSDGLSSGTLIVNKANSQTSLTFDKTSPQTFGTSITPNCSIISGVGTPLLTLNGNSISSDIPLTLGAGTSNFNCSLSSSQNYTYSENLSSFSINKASTTTSLITIPDSSINYGNISNFSCSNLEGFDTSLYINGIDKSNEKGLNVVRGAGNYSLNCSFQGNQNYSASSFKESYIINKATGNIKLYLNSNEDNITIDYPEQFIINSTSSYGQVSIYKDGLDITGINNLYITPERASAVYNITAVSSGDENHSSETITRWLNVTLDITPPIINLMSPQEGDSYGYNISLPLTYSVIDNHLDSCWFNINDNQNISIPNCQNTTFNLTNDGSYTLYLYSNDSLGNINVKNSTFSILVGAPTLTLDSPIGIYLNTQNITFRYTPTDLDLRSCELWGDFDSEFKLNQTNNMPVSGVENTFNLNLVDKTYRWNIRCNDSMGNFVFNGNKTFYVDTIKPSITISQPVGKQTTRTNIPLAFSVLDLSPLTCSYSITTSIGNLIIGNTLINNCSNSLFNVANDGDYIVNISVMDFAGNVNYMSSSFSVDTSTPVVIIPPSGGGSSGGGGGGGDGGGGSVAILTSKELNIEITPIETIMYPGEENSLELSVKNKASKSVNKCRIKSSEGQESWISTTDIKNIAAGEILEFKFKLTLPENADPKLSLECLEGSKPIPLKVTLVKSTLDIKISEISLEKGNQILIKYTAESDSNSLVDLIFSVYTKTEKVKEQQVSLTLVKGQKLDQQLFIELGDISPGLLKIAVTKQGEEKSITEESILYGSKITGFAVNNLVSNPSNISIIIIVIIFFSLAGLIIRKIIINRRSY